jgi:hypothetical protein
MIELARIMARSSLTIPYTSQIHTLVNNINTIQMERSPTDLDFQALYTWGTNVSDPVTTPIRPK